MYFPVLHNPITACGPLNLPAGSTALAAAPALALAQTGGKNPDKIPDKIPEALDKALEVLGAKAEK
jgi:hypothetical protein